ncbi:MAG: XTP/dITP diphosphatase [Planctomycetes bacterium]|nr:XTP/dITP diphosphatase [Planctomycetota bacterium]
MVVGTRNLKKKKEIERILEGFPVCLQSLDDYADAPDVDEDAPSFEGNARKKALTLADALGRWVVADDSGLEVDALAGGPGVRSARYAGPNATGADLCRKLLGELEGVPHEKRTARFRCAAAVARPGEVLFTVEARCEGCITNEMRGKGGFGYDPIFFYPDYARTFAEMSPDEKNSVSHRGRALAMFKAELQKYLKHDEPAGRS